MALVVRLVLIIRWNEVNSVLCENEARCACIEYACNLLRETIRVTCTRRINFHAVVSPFLLLLIISSMNITVFSIYLDVTSSCSCIGNSTNSNYSNDNLSFFRFLFEGNVVQMCYNFRSIWVLIFMIISCTRDSPWRGKLMRGGRRIENQRNVIKTKL